MCFPATMGKVEHSPIVIIIITLLKLSIYLVTCNSHSLIHLFYTYLSNEFLVIPLLHLYLCMFAELFDLQKKTTEKNEGIVSNCLIHRKFSGITHKMFLSNITYYTF